MASPASWISFNFHRGKRLLNLLNTVEFLFSKIKTATVYALASVMSAGCYLLFRDKVVFIPGERARENGAEDLSWERYSTGRW